MKELLDKFFDLCREYQQEIISNRLIRNALVAFLTNLAITN